MKKTLLLSMFALFALSSCGGNDTTTTTSKAPCTNHEIGEFVRRIKPSNDLEGFLAHYKCKNCDQLLDMDGKPCTYEDLLLPSYSDRVNNFADYIMSEDTSTCGKWDDIDEASQSWVHYNDTDSIQTKDVSAWRLSEDNFYDIEFTLNLNHAAIRNPYHSGDQDFITKAFFIGASINSNVHFPKGYAISLNTTAYNSGYYSDSWIQIWEVNDVVNDKMKGTFLGGVNVQTENGTFTFKVIDGILTIHDMYGTALTIVYDGLASSLSYLPLPKYKGGKVGIYNWKLLERAVNTTFTITDFKSCRDDESTMIEKDGIGQYKNIDKSKMVNVFLMAGQSNMEGNSRAYEGGNQYLKNYCNDSRGEHSYTQYQSGYESIQISTCTKYPWGANHNYSNTDDPLFGSFDNTKLGYGQEGGDKFFGPELGLAEILDKQDLDNPTYLIKFANGGTGFCSYPSWLTPKSSSTPGALYRGIVSYVYNNLSAILDEGYIPVIKGFLWMQGECDSSYAEASKYESREKALVESLRDEFAKYAVDGDGDNITFIDACISDRSTWEAHLVINNAKKEVCDYLDNAYLIDTNSTGIDLVVNNDRYGGGDQYHYTADSMIKLGNAFGNIIVNNNLLDF